MAGKAALPVRMLLNHQAGLPVIDRKLSFEEVSGHRGCRALAAQAPVWEPGTRHGYHALTYGWLIGELVRRVTGKSLGTFFAEEVARPLGLDFWIGLPADELGRVATEVPADIHAAARPADSEPTVNSPKPWRPSPTRSLSPPGRCPSAAPSSPPRTTSGDAEGRRRFYGSEIPSVNGIGTARSLARLYAACVSTVDGFRLLSEDTITRAITTQSHGSDAVLIMPTRYGLGFWLPTAWSPCSGRRRSAIPEPAGSLGVRRRRVRRGVRLRDEPSECGRHGQRRPQEAAHRRRTPVAALTAAQP